MSGVPTVPSEGFTDPERVSQEAVHRRASRIRPAPQLEGHLPVERGVMGAIDLAEAAVADLLERPERAPGEQGRDGRGGRGRRADHADTPLTVAASRGG